ncbi:hypothetical protein [Lentzea fradiae]|nr:hypothetical protein [Lentzea fradiae]
MHITEENKLKGSLFIEAYGSLIDGISKDAESETEKALDITFNAIGAASATVMLAIDPLGSIIGAGVGWLIEHVSFLRDALNQLMGNPEEIQANVEANKQRAVEIRQLAEDHKNGLATFDGWTGESSELFKTSMDGMYQELDELASAVETKAKIVAIMGMLVQVLRDIVRDLIAQLIGSLIGGAILAAAAMIPTFGASIPIFCGFAVGKAVALGTNIASRVARVVAALARQMKRIGDLDDIMAKISKGWQRFENGADVAEISWEAYKAQNDVDKAVDGARGGSGSTQTSAAETNARTETVQARPAETVARVAAEAPTAERAVMANALHRPTEQATAQVQGKLANEVMRPTAQVQGTPAHALLRPTEQVQATPAHALLRPTEQVQATPAMRAMAPLEPMQQGTPAMQPMEALQPRHEALRPLEPTQSFVRAERPVEPLQPMQYGERIAAEPAQPFQQARLADTPVQPFQQAQARLADVQPMQYGERIAAEPVQPFQQARLADTPVQPFQQAQARLADVQPMQYGERIAAEPVQPFQQARLADTPVQPFQQATASDSTVASGVSMTAGSPVHDVQPMQAREMYYSESTPSSEPLQPMSSGYEPMARTQMANVAETLAPSQPREFSRIEAQPFYESVNPLTAHEALRPTAGFEAGGETSATLPSAPERTVRRTD